ncbi:FAD/NAD(P)-binding protein [Niastella populi]|uniref:FAD-dependent urate hydroxylase HpyO/Asp monooxygenase CreE-like FAD/NAD(P)-binding domain-containing protein n=1 Tax=Niastella populi TaxID=550983 RepID=A0A1V9GD97_9BACT|nr:FAD/NAD(P)-binding protein [Niastella populi]OQP68649.1 hypothetical protein A4R26_02305 [Niastella populi]
MQQIVVIGSGLSGTLFTINILRHHHHSPISITVIDKNPPGTLGLAYSTDHSFHLLNVPAFKMSAFPDNSNDFTDWLSKAGYPYDPHSFVPRKVYREYILSLLQNELSRKKENIHYTYINDSAIDIVPQKRLLLLGSGRQVPFHKLVLAVGNFNPAPLRLPDNDYLRHPAYFSSAWDNHLANQHSPWEHVLIIGTGLTMVDTVLTLQRSSPDVLITALSNHGYMPLSHERTAGYQLEDKPHHDISTLSEALQIVNKHIKKSREQKIGWQAVVDAIRPYTQEVWHNFSYREKKKFLGRLRHIWGVARHRMPPECAEQIHRLLLRQQLFIAAGQIQSINLNASNGFDVFYHEKSTRRNVQLTTNAIINCMGPECNYENLDDPLIKNLLQRGLIRSDELRLGLDCSPGGIIIEKNGAPSPFLFTLGPPVKGILWEITSVPEIRVAALQLAKLVAGKKVESIA